MRSLMILLVACVMTVGSFLVMTPPASSTVEMSDHPHEVAARYHYRIRRGSIFRR